jgi:hypothetical protein
MAKRYDKFPKYSLWTGLMNVCSYQVLTIGEDIERVARCISNTSKGSEKDKGVWF